MNKNTAFANFDQLLDSLDSEVSSNVREIEKTTRVSRKLQLLRMKKGLSQKEVASRIGCTQGRISKIEHKFDDDLTLGELKSYLQAVQAGMGITIGPKLTLAESINKNIKELDSDLQKLKCVKHGGDDALSKAIDDYLATSHKKLLSLVLKGMSEMQVLPEKSDSIISFNISGLDSADEEDCGGCKNHAQSSNLVEAE
jgi:transcriptional regulator with XRE-family HTH domain